MYLLEIGDAINSYLGVHYEVLFYIAQTSALHFGPVEQSDNLGSHAQSPVLAGKFESVWDVCAIIEQGLQEWQALNSDLILVALASGYKSAALIYLYRRIRRHTSNHKGIAEVITAEVSKILKSLVGIPPNRYPDSVLLFPLFIARGDATSLEDINTIRDRLHLINKSRGFRNVLRACNVLEEVWKARCNNANPHRVDWQDVLQRQGGGLILT